MKKTLAYFIILFAIYGYTTGSEKQYYPKPGIIKPHTIRNQQNLKTLKTTVNEQYKQQYDQKGLTFEEQTQILLNELKDIIKIAKQSKK